MRYSGLVWWVLLVAPVFGDPPAGIAESVAKLVTPYLDAEVVNAVSIGVVDGDSSWTQHYGDLSTDNRTPPTDATIYEIGSISKVFTGILLADSVVDQRLKLDQTIGDIVPELNANAEISDSIQLVHLATHMSGLPRMPSNMKPADVENPYADYDREDMLAFLGKLKPKRKPGLRSEYSNLAVGLLGQILSIDAKQSYARMLKENLTRPLAMNQTSIDLADDQLRHLAPPHNGDREPAKNWDLNSFAGAGGIRSNTTDMLKFMDAQLHPPAGRIGKAIELAWEQKLPAQGGAFAMGLGWHIARDGETRWHNGQTGGYHTAMFVDRRINAGVIVMGNTATGEIDALAESIIQLVAGMDVNPREFPKLAKVDPAIAQRLAGEYRLAPGILITVRADGADLFVQLTGQPELRVYPESETRWRYRVVDAQLVFDLPETGSAAEVTLHQNGRKMRSPRTPND